MQRRSIRGRIRSGETLLVPLVQTPWPAVCEVLAAAGMDAICVEAEHSPLSPADIQNLILATEAAGLPALVRVRENDAPSIQFALDGGACGVIVPRVHSAADARRAVASARYPPEGERGAGPGRAAIYGLDRVAATEFARAETFVAVQIESRAAVDDLDAILAVPGVDMAFIGPNDLAYSYGEDSYETAAMQAVIDDVIARSRAAGVGCGILAVTPAAIHRSRDAGCGLLLVATDLLLLARGARDLLAEVAAIGRQR